MIVSEYLSLLVISILIMYPSSISERSCHHRLTAEDILELMDNSDIDLSDDETNLAEMERDGYDSNLDSSLDDTVLYTEYAPSDEEAVVPTPRKRRTIWRKTATFDPAVVPAPLRRCRT